MTVEASIKAEKSEEEFSIIRPSSDRAVVGSVVKVDSSVPSTPDVIMAGLWFWLWLSSLQTPSMPMPVSLKDVLMVVLEVVASVPIRSRLVLSCACDTTKKVALSNNTASSASQIRQKSSKWLSKRPMLGMIENDCSHAPCLKISRKTRYCKSYKVVKSFIQTINISSHHSGTYEHQNTPKIY